MKTKDRGLPCVLVFGKVVLRCVLFRITCRRVSRWLMVWLTFLGAIVGEHNLAAGGHSQKLPASLPTPIRVGPQ